MRPLGKETLGVILAGGRDTRLGALTRERCKPALHLGAACRSIDYTLSNSGNSGLHRIAIAVQYQS